MKPGKHAQSFVLRLYTMNELRKKRFHWLGLQYAEDNYCVLCTVKAKKENKNLQQRHLWGCKTVFLY